MTSVPSGYSSGDEYFATKYSQGGRNVFSIDLSPAQIAATVEKPDPLRPTRTNRMIALAHAQSFAKYLRDTPKRVIPPLLLRAPKGTLEFTTKELVQNTAFGLMTIPRLARHDIEILDGQHRVLGMHIEMEAISSELKTKRSERSQTGTHVDSGVRVAQEKRLDSEIANLERQREKLAEERVTVQIIEIDDEEEIRQMFADIAINAKGINQAVRAKFDQTRLVNRVMENVVDEAALLCNRTDGEKDRMLGDNPNLVAAQHVADVVRTVLVGIGGRVTVRRESEVKEDEVKDDTLLFVDTLAQSFDDYQGILKGALTPAELRAKSLLGSPVMFRILAGVFYRLTVSGGTGRPDAKKVKQVGDLFRRLQPWMELPASWASGSPWTGSGALASGSRSARSRRQDLEELVNKIISWSKVGVQTVEKEPAEAKSPG